MMAVMKSRGRIPAARAGPQLSITFTDPYACLPPTSGVNLMPSATSRPKKGKVLAWEDAGCLGGSLLERLGEGPRVVLGEAPRDPGRFGDGEAPGRRG